MYCPIAITIVSASAASAASAATLAPSPRVTLLARVRHALAVRRQRQALAELDSRQLLDIGVSEKHARQEAGRGLLDVPTQKV